MSMQPEHELALDRSVRGYSKDDLGKEVNLQDIRAMVSTGDFGEHDPRQVVDMIRSIYSAYDYDPIPIGNEEARAEMEGWVSQITGRSDKYMMDLGGDYMAM